jgi:type VI secretion system protein VasJ
VLGTVESDQIWRWAAFGKHPVASDFFRMGPDFPLARAFSDWVEKGYRGFVSKKEGYHSLCSWRFWAKGFQKNSLACGLVKDSIDSVGRPFPLLVMGTGPLRGWEEHWDLLPFACERTWGQIESLSVQMFKDLKKLEGEVRGVRPPIPEWSDLTSRRGDLRGFEATLDRDLKGKASLLSEKAEIFLPLDQDPVHDRFTLISLWHSLLKNEGKKVPNVLFMGGTFETSCLAVFRRPLMATDFVQLWSVLSQRVKENGSRITG